MRKPTVGFIGLGCLGRPMAERLLSLGFPLIAYNRTPSKAKALVTRGARLAESPLAAVRDGDVLITVVGDDEALESICFGDRGIVAALGPGKTHLEMSTVSPALAVRLAAAVQAQRADFLDAPVLGSGPQAIEGRLILMIGGKKEVLEKNLPVLEALGHKIVRTGAAGSASLLKLVTNQFIASMMLGFAQGMTLARRGGLSPELVMDVLEDSALRSPFYTGKLDRLRRRNFKPNFSSKWMLKDIDLMLGAGAKWGVPLPGIVAARQVYRSAVAEGLGDLDYSVIIEVLEREAGIEPSEPA